MRLRENCKKRIRCHKGHMFPIGLELAPFGLKVAERSSGQVPRVALHVNFTIYTK